MRVKVDLFADMREFSDRPSFEAEIQTGSTVKDLLSQLSIPEEFSVLVVVNEVMVSPDHKLCDGDSVGLFPPMGGGGLSLFTGRMP